ncbi:hypothetical protein [Jiella marina]|uniref:hypothetical protein n=1 Tax=Jiella sp. LLJ827 TaxID=2917712 RepID=UPI0021016F05|nr:hypothetical protein [Jiella sp. LLJ827]MCQ0987467.1 hypothetical protein [Jiella sp. LLJ827]
MLEALPPVPPAYRGLWERTALERLGPGLLTDDRPARVFWLQTERWHADLRVPEDRPDFGAVDSLEACSDAQLAFIAGQDAFCGLTRVEGAICIWQRLFDLRPLKAPDIGRMELSADRIIEHGVVEAYREEWSLVAGSRDGETTAPGAMAIEPTRDIVLTAGAWRIVVTPRPPAPEWIDPFVPIADCDRATLLWRTAMSVTLYRRDGAGWQAELSTHPWLEGRRIGEMEAVACA